MFGVDLEAMQHREVLSDTLLASLMGYRNRRFCENIGIPMIVNTIAAFHNFSLLKPNEYKRIRYGDYDYIIIADHGYGTYFGTREYDDVVYVFRLKDDPETMRKVNSNIENLIITMFLVDRVGKIEDEYSIENFRSDYEMMEPSLQDDTITTYWGEYISMEDGTYYS